jgi:ubiquinone/menaquinone biosynthesis C-methylase UbiE
LSLINTVSNIDELFVKQPLKMTDGIYSFVDRDSVANVHSNPVTRKINEFYEQNPFPNYEEYDSLSTFYEKASKGIYAKMLDEQIPLNVKILESGCGTGQLSVFLSKGQRTVVGQDLCLNSLRLANNFKTKYGIPNLELVHADIFDLPFREGEFDFVISKGVLHHTFDCKKAFECIARLVKPGGFIIIGLYNKYGRIPSWLRKQVYKIIPHSVDKLDYVLKNFAQGDQKRNSWILDQYSNPHETWHSADEVLGWFGEYGFEYVNSVPKITLSETFTVNEKLFRKHNAGSHAGRLAAQLLWIFTISREGALFDIIGRKKI